MTNETQFVVVVRASGKVEIEWVTLATLQICVAEMPNGEKVPEGGDQYGEHLAVVYHDCQRVDHYKDIFAAYKDTADRRDHMKARTAILIEMAQGGAQERYVAACDKGTPDVVLKRLSRDMDPLVSGAAEENLLADEIEG